MTTIRQRHIDWPPVCACCEAPAAATIPSQPALFRRRPRHPAVPICERCTAHVAAHVAAEAHGRRVALVAHGWGVLLYVATRSPIIGLAWCGALLAALAVMLVGRRRARTRCTAACASAGPPVVDRLLGGSRFASDGYAARVTGRDVPRATVVPPRDPG